LATKFELSAKNGVEILASSIVKSRLKSPADAYLSVTHTPTESEFADFEVNDPFIDGFIGALDKVVNDFESLLLPDNYQVIN
jgi:hypothetical protein